MLKGILISRDPRFPWRLDDFQAIEERGLSVPDDVSLVSFDDFDFAPFLRCPLTVVEQPKEAMGEAAVKAAECIDRCLGRLEEAVTEAGGVLLITSDHGNCESMLDEDADQPYTAHTMNLVPVLMVNAPDGVGGLR